MSSAIWGRHFVRHLSWCLAQNISWEMYLLKNTRWHPYWANERSIFSPLSLIGPQSLQNKGSKLLEKYRMALPPKYWKIPLSRKLTCTHKYSFFKFVFHFQCINLSYPDFYKCDKNLWIVHQKPLKVLLFWYPCVCIVQCEKYILIK